MIIIKTSTDSHKAMKKIANELLNNIAEDELFILKSTNTNLFLFMSYV